MDARTIVQIPCGTTQQGLGCVEIDNVMIDSRVATKKLVASCTSFREIGRKYGVDWYPFYDVFRGRAGRKAHRYVRQVLGLESVQSTPPAILAWQIRNRVEA